MKQVQLMTCLDFKKEREKKCVNQKNKIKGETWMGND